MKDTPLQYEVEIKSLLIHEEEATRIKDVLLNHSTPVTHVSHVKQLNHYFVGDTLNSLVENINPYISKHERSELQDIASIADGFSLRTRLEDDTVSIVLKVSIDDTSSENGISRLEFSAIVDLPLDELDRIILSSGFSYQSKWSRERENMLLGDDLNIAIDKNAGYGYLIEFETIVHDKKDVPQAREKIINLLNDLNIEELPQNRLEKMFQYYNNNWQEYYGTNKTFIIE